MAKIQNSKTLKAGDKLFSHRIKAKNPVEAWEKINELLALGGDAVLAQGGIMRGNQSFLYLTTLDIHRMKADPEFDFGALCGYTVYKWSSLINNYLDFNALEELKKEVNGYDKEGKEYYSTFMNFVNTSKQGHSCLISLGCCRYGLYGEPLVIVNARASEVTKRLMMDLVLIQRIIEYIYGTNKVRVLFNSYYSFLTPEGFAMYHNHKPLPKLFKKVGKQNDPDAEKWVNTIKQCFNDLLKVDEKDVKYKVMLRAVRQLQRGEDGKPISGRKPLLVRDLKLFKKVTVKEIVTNKTVVMYPITKKIPKEVKVKKENISDPSSEVIKRGERGLPKGEVKPKTQTSNGDTIRTGKRGRPRKVVPGNEPINSYGIIPKPGITGDVRDKQKLQSRKDTKPKSK